MRADDQPLPEAGDSSISLGIHLPSFESLFGLSTIKDHGDSDQKSDEDLAPSSFAEESFGAGEKASFQDALPVATSEDAMPSSFVEDGQEDKEHGRVQDTVQESGESGEDAIPSSFVEEGFREEEKLARVEDAFLPTNIEDSMPSSFAEEDSSMRDELHQDALHVALLSEEAAPPSAAEVTESAPHDEDELKGEDEGTSSSESRPRWRRIKSLEAPEPMSLVDDSIEETSPGGAGMGLDTSNCTDSMNRLVSGSQCWCRKEASCLGNKMCLCFGGKISANLEYPRSYVPALNERCPTASEDRAGAGTTWKREQDCETLKEHHGKMGSSLGTNIMIGAVALATVGMCYLINKPGE